MVRSMGPISEVDMTYSMDCYFRQSWVDRRLAFQGGKETLALSISMLARIWKPDTYFYNGKQSYLHTITSPNKFVRLYQDGRVLYSSRLTIKAGCPMNLEDFPMDTQRCPLKFGSFGYTTRDVIYKWNSARQVAIAEDMKLSQFDLVANPTANHSTTPPLSHAEYSMLLVYFHLQRHMGNFLIQVYGPCILLVVLSWVSFWLNREATADRVSLGITTVLTMTFLGLEARTDLPKVPYPTALDFFVFLSFAFIFATIIQFAIVHYFTKYGSGECYFSSDLSDTESSSSENEEISRSPSKRETSRRKNSGNSIPGSSQNFTVNDDGFIEVIPLSAIPDRERTIAHWQLPCISCSPSVSHPRRESSHQTVSIPMPIPQPQPQPQTQPEPQPQPISQSQSQGQSQLRKSPSPQRVGSPNKRIAPRKRRRRTPKYNSVSKIDRASRVVFPLFFLAINVFYWYAYLSRSERINYYNSNPNGA
ncbi:gamma-aminobutyric acid receptor alpha-like isoform X3 [Vespa crabro]|nr:gamma-aminobutyric acid receptor alpha-like isoform X3 [Vespa crabro]